MSPEKTLPLPQTAAYLQTFGGGSISTKAATCVEEKQS
jgi:hypothetical protein